MSNLIYGMHSVDGAVRGNHVDQLYVCKDRNSEKVMRVIEAAQKNKIPVSFMDAQWFKNNFNDNNHQFIAASSKNDSLSKLSLEDFLANTIKQHFFLILDEVQVEFFPGQFALGIFGKQLLHAMQQGRRPYLRDQAAPEAAHARASLGVDGQVTDLTGHP